MLRPERGDASRNDQHFNPKQAYHNSIIPYYSTMADLWMLLYGERQEQKIQLDILLEAYSEFMMLQEKELALIEPLRAMRMVHYLAWIILRWEDPAFPPSFPWIKDDDFWFRQTAIGFVE